MKKYDCPVILVGDLNCTVKSSALQSAFSRGYAHAYELATDYRDEGHGMHMCGDAGYAPYVPAEPDKAPDHILIKNAPDGFVRRFDRFNAEYYMPISDHLPAFIDVKY